MYYIHLKLLIFNVLILILSPVVHVLRKVIAYWFVNDFKIQFRNQLPYSFVSFGIVIFWGVFFVKCTFSSVPAASVLNSPDCKRKKASALIFGFSFPPVVNRVSKSRLSPLFHTSCSFF